VAATVSVTFQRHFTGIRRRYVATLRIRKVQSSQVDCAIATRRSG
jgi:hypothetical protein